MIGREVNERFPSRVGPSKLLFARPTRGCPPFSGCCRGFVALLADDRRYLNASQAWAFSSY